MATAVLGRTNEAFPRVWLTLELPASEADAEALAEVAVSARTPLDISRHPAYWGRFLRAADTPILARGSYDIERAVDERHAADLTQAHLIETLSSIGRQTVDFYFLRLRRPLQEFQVGGALEALEGARQEGHIKFAGLWCEDALAARAAWQVHDAFEVVCLPGSDEAYEGLARLAKERRVGVLERDAVVGPRDRTHEHTRLETVRSAQEAIAAMEAS